MDRQTKVARAHTALAWLYGILLALFLWMLMSIDAGKRAGIAGVFIILGIALAVHYFTARACKAGSEGGRVASIIIACFMLLGFPVGTLIGAYLLANTWSPWDKPA